MNNMINKRFFTLLSVSVVFFLTFGVFLGIVQAKEINQKSPPLLNKISIDVSPTPFPEISSFISSSTFTFKDFDQENLIIEYPGSDEVYFDLPNRWAIAGEGLSYLELHYDLDDPSFDPLFEPSTGTSGLESRDLVPKLEVYINDYFVDSFIPQIGKNFVQKILLPSEILVDPIVNNPYNEFTIRFEYKANWDEFCEYYGTLTIQDHSFVHVEFSVFSPIFNLSMYHNAITQDSFMPETHFIVIPDDYNENDLNTALLLLNDITEKTFGNVQVELLPASEVSEEILSKSSLITIGSPARNKFTKELFNNNLLTPWLNGDNEIQYSVNLSDGDGLLQLIPNYTNGNYGILVVTGNSDEGVSHSADALLNPLPDMIGAFYIVKDTVEIPSLTQTSIFSEIMTFQSLGFRETARYGIGTLQSYLTFYLPRNWKITDDAALTLIYSHSSNLSNMNSNLTIELNGQLIGTAPIDSQEQDDRQVVIPLDPEKLIPGSINLIRFEMILSAPIECSLFNARAFWVTLRDRSSLYLPHEEITNEKDLPAFIHPLYFLAYDNSSIIASLPQEPSKSDFYGLAKISQYLSKLSPNPIQISVNLDPNKDFSTFADENILMIGKPSENSRIWEINEKLPQPFVPENDTLLEKIGNIPFQVPSNIDIGLIEVLPSPWNSQKGITLVTGTTDKGFTWGIDMLSSDEFVYDFYGDVFFVYDQTLSSFQSVIQQNTVDIIVSDIVKEEILLQTVVPTETPTPNPVIVDRYDKPDQQDTSQLGTRVIGQIILALILTTGILVAVITILRTVRGGRKS